MKAIISLGLLTLAGCAPSGGSQSLPPSVAGIVGTFVDIEGRPVPDGLLFGDSLAAEVPIAISDAMGQFQLGFEWKDDQYGQRYDCYAKKQGYAKLHFWAHPRPGQVFDLEDLIVNRTGTLIGKVIDESGKPLEGVTVLVEHEDQDAFMQSWASRRHPRLYALATTNWLESATTSESGEYEFDGIPPGNCSLQANHESFFWHTSDFMQLEANSTVNVPPIQLEAIPESLQIQGRVLGPGRSHVSNAEISAELATGFTVGSLENCMIWEETIPISTLTDSLGNFTLCLPFRPSSPIQLFISPSQEKLDIASIDGVQPGDRDVQIILGATQKLVLRIIDSQGLPVENFGCVLDIYDSEDPGASEISERRKIDPTTHLSGRGTFCVPAKRFYLNITTDSGRWQEIGMFAPGSLPTLLEITLK